MQKQRLDNQGDGLLRSQLLHQGQQMSLNKFMILEKSD